MKQEEKLCQQHTVLHVFSIRPSGLCHSYCDPLPNTPQKKKKKKGEWRKRIQLMFFPSLLEMSSELPGRGMQAIPWSWGMTWELRYMGAIRGEGPWLPVSPGLFGLDGSVILPHRWRLACLSLSPPAPQASCAYQLCAKHTAVHGKTVPANLEQWFITNNRRRYREVCVNAVQHEWSRLQLMKSKKKIASESEKELFTLFRGLRNVHINYDNQMFRHAKPASGC